MSTIYVVATPIGNLEDITLRALKILKEVPIIFCEDTRESIKLLKKYGIKAKLISYYKPKEKERIPWILRELKSGKDCALIADSGTPLLSDPGALLLREALKEGIKVVPIPGVSAVTAALMVSGFDVQSFTFAGFPPKGEKRLKEFVEKIMKIPHTVVFYERADRVKSLIEIISEKDRKREIVMGREMTKIFEEFLRGNAEDLLGEIKERELKGEITIVMEGRKEKETQSKRMLKDILKILYVKYKVPKPILKHLTKLY